MYGLDYDYLILLQYKAVMLRTEFPEWHFLLPVGTSESIGDRFDFSVNFSSSISQLNAVFPQISFFIALLLVVRRNLCTDIPFHSNINIVITVLLFHTNHYKWRIINVTIITIITILRLIFSVTYIYYGTSFVIRSRSFPTTIFLVSVSVCR